MTTTIRSVSPPGSPKQSRRSTGGYTLLVLFMAGLAIAAQLVALVPLSRVLMTSSSHYYEDTTNRRIMTTTRRVLATVKPQMVGKDSFPDRCSLASCSSSTVRDEEVVDVVILGAGIAGLTAAHTLEQYNNISYTLLEATSRIGGRMENFDGFRRHRNNDDMVSVEQHAAWIGGASPNPMFDLAVEFGLKLFRQSFTNIGAWNVTGGNRIGPYRHHQARWHGLHKATRCIKQIAINMNEEWNQTGTMPHVNMTFAEGLTQYCKWNESQARMADFMEYDFADGTPWETSILTSLGYASDVDFKDESGNSGAYLVVDPRGFAHVARQFAETRLRQPPQLDTQACRIEQQQDGTVELTTNTCQRLRTRRVISTMSPYFWMNYPDLFSPPLDRGAAMRRAGYKENPYVKVYFQFPVAFWPINVEYVYLASGSNAEFGPHHLRGDFKCHMFQNFNYRPASNSTSTRTEKTLLNGQKEEILQDEIWPGSKILMCFARRQAVVSLDNKIDDARVMALLDPMRQAFRNKGYVEPVAIRVPDSKQDPIAGGYFIYGPGFSIERYIEAIAPDWNNALHWSGSYSCRRHAGWTQGGYYAGIRTAHQVLRSLLGNEAADKLDIPRTSPECDDWRRCKVAGMQCVKSRQCCGNDICNSGICEPVRQKAATTEASR